MRRVWILLSVWNISQDQTTLTYTADEAWLTDPARVYPVVIDPVVWTKQSSSDIYDAYVEDSHKYSNFGSNILKTGYGSSRNRSYIKFRNLPEINADEIVRLNCIWQSWAPSSYRQCASNQ